MSFGEFVRHRRLELKLTQDQVAARTGISKPYLSNIETGRTKNPPSDRVLALLERVLDFSKGTLRNMADDLRTPMDVRQKVEILAAEVEKLRGVLKGLLTKRPGGAKAKDLEAAARSTLKKDANVSPVAAARAVPLINSVMAGYPHHFTDMDYPPSVADEYVRTPDLHDPQAFAARVVGDSMEPKYHEGDVIIFAPNTPAKSGDDCFVRFTDDNSTTFKRIYQQDDGRVRLQPLNESYPAEVYDAEALSGLWPAVMRIERLR
jgi:phage repressor protein C with HTH and peptisase S24 domain